MPESRKPDELGHFRAVSADTVLAALPVFVLVVDPDGFVVSLNRTRADYPPEKILGKPVFGDVAEAHRSLYEQNIRKVAETGEEISFQCQNGQLSRWYSVQLSRIATQEGPRVVVVATNITAQREMEDATRADSARVKQVLSRVPALIWTTDLDLRVTSLEGAQYASRLTMQAMIGKTLAEAAPPNADLTKVLNATEKALQGETSSYEQHWDDSYFEVSVEPLHNDHGDIVGTLGVGMDITRRWQQQQELEKAKKQLQQKYFDTSEQLEQASDRLKQRDHWLANLVDAFPIGAAITRERDGLILAINDMAAAAHARTAKEMLNTTAVANYVDPNQRQQMIDRMKNEGRPSREVVEIHRGDGKPGWLAVYVHRLEFSGESCFFTLIRDITKEEQDRQRLINERSRLQQIVEVQERDRQLLAYEIHDGMVQDLTGAKMFLDVFRHTNPDADSQGNLDRSFKLLGKSIDEARRLINGLRPPVLEQEGLLMAIQSLVTEFQTVHEIAVEFEHDVSFDPFPSAMELAIYRIVQESLTNIWRHSQSPTARLTMKQLGSMIVIRVEDDGVGFDVTAPRENHFGLAGIEERACLLGGEASIVSTPGLGTKIEVQFPVDPSSQPFKVQN